MRVCGRNRGSPHRCTAYHSVQADDLTTGSRPRGAAYERTAMGVVRLASAVMDQPDLSREAREAVLKAIIKCAPSVGNSPAGIRDLAEAYAFLERDLVPHASVVRHRT
jgi:hypothetical protein